MTWTDDTILITGGGSGIGEGLAVALHRAGNHVVVAGRRPEALEAVARRHPGISCLPLDQSDAGAVRAFAEEVVRRHPRLNVLVNNAGIMRTEDLQAPDPDVVDDVVSTNLLGPLLLTAHLLPALRRRPSAAIVNVTSSLAFVPKATLPTYCATKAAMHSYTESLRYQLRDSGIRVIEIPPPRVYTDGSADDDHGVGVDAFARDVVSQLVSHPEAQEIVVDAARLLRFAERRGDYENVYSTVNFHDSKGTP
ncbi:SDR family NAD(P)-dependent oxidoreductase [Mycolicibacterium sp. P1-18]|uniref:SDR family oxidoreductase n=1 Tax=Mycolicibacterium sp. P1-18 TaxID=2024615 RepID=UPI0011F1C28E|nr:SDR family NAD(P)-dependent oxidoreductase [Mycolicibacterium sp. P1-18]KAA0100720.1 SDR family NAD(P)-dependent oxidoreductase [Mycolicibacterium sp. P1-18]